jgi:uncharacterized protein YrrD
MGMRHVGDLLRLPVRHNGIELGRPVDVLLDLDAGRVLGLEVRCPDDAHRFVPLGAARLAPDATEVASPLALLDDVAFYRSRGAAFRELRGATVDDGRVTSGTLADVVLSDGGTMDFLVVETTSGLRRVPFGPRVSLVSQRSASAA